jgi:hypothetical protein
MTKNKHLRRALVFTSVLSVPAFYAFCWWYCTDYYPKQNTVVGPVHTFQLNAEPPFLSDALAVEKAKESLALDGYDLASWQLREDRRSTAPDGTPDVYLLRNGKNLNLGEIVFLPRNGDSLPRISVAIEFTEGQMKCQVSCAKYRP